MANLLNLGQLRMHFSRSNLSQFMTKKFLFGGVSMIFLDILSKKWSQRKCISTKVLNSNASFARLANLMHFTSADDY